MIRLLEKLSGSLGLHVATLAFCAGLAVAAGPSLWSGFKLGHLFGWNDGFAAADKQAEINDLERQLAEEKRDRKAAQERADAMREQAEQNARAMLTAQEDRDGYRAELEQLAAAANEPSPDEEPAPACPTKVVDLRCRAALPVDVGRLQRNHWRPVDGSDGPIPPQHE